MAVSKHYTIVIHSPAWDKDRVFHAGLENDFHLDTRTLFNRYGGSLPARWLDLLRIASSVYVADLAVLRGKSWRRSVGLDVPVLDHDFWSKEAVSSLLRQLVSFLSGDAWTLHLTPDRSKYSAPIQRQRFLSESLSHRNEVACLYSGGLDSAAGIVARLRTSNDLQLAPVTVVHRQDIGSQVRSQLAVLQQRFNGRLSPIAVPFEFRRSDRSRKREPTQRTRAFLFASVGCVVGAINETNRVEAYESGVGALNTPLLGSMRGSQATRGMHPHALGLMSDLASHLFDNPFQISLPFMQQTKAEVVRTLSEANLGQLARDTVSCVHYPVRHEAGKGHRQCGVCPACLFRRVALTAAGIEEPTNTYQIDVLDPNAVLDEQKMRLLAAFLNQVDAINASGGAGIPATIASHLRRTGVVTPGQVDRTIADLYRRYADGWNAFIRQGRRNGCHWTNLIDARSAAA